MALTKLASRRLYGTPRPREAPVSYAVQLALVGVDKGSACTAQRHGEACRVCLQGS
jgi:hypothetical protein